MITNIIDIIKKWIKQLLESVKFKKFEWFHDDLVEMNLWEVWLHFKQIKYALEYGFLYDALIPWNQWITWKQKVFFCIFLFIIFIFLICILILCYKFIKYLIKKYFIKK